MKLTAFAMMFAVLNAPLSMAQSNGVGTTSGDSAISPATGNSTKGVSGSNDRHTTGAGVNSGVLDNGTTGDTIGVGSGTTSSPTPRLGTTSLTTRKE